MAGSYGQNLEIVGEKILPRVVSSFSNLEVRTPLGERKEYGSFKISATVDDGVLERVEDTVGSVKPDAANGMRDSSVSSSIFCSDPNSFVFSDTKVSVVHEAISSVRTNSSDGTGDSLGETIVEPGEVNNLSVKR
ncbi:hypothetical protein ACOSQ4_021643 [Xanthoceras sorbifolium]